jgi:hypothetical protein
MIKTVMFKNQTGEKPSVEFKEYSEDFLKAQPEIFNNTHDGHAQMRVLSLSSEFFRDGDASKKPDWYFRQSNVDSTRWIGFTKLSDDPLEPQLGGLDESDGLGGTNVPVVPFGKISDDPVCYGISAEDHSFEYRFYLDHATVKEGDVFEGYVDYFPFAVVDHNSIWNNALPIYMCGVLTGSYMGQPVKGIGRINISFMPKSHSKKKYELKGYFDNMFYGIREDGRKETAIVHLDHSGKVFAYYWLEGEGFVTSDEVEMESEWYRLPYCNDGTCIYKRAVYKFAGKEIHFDGKWGTKGFTKRPRIEDKPGQSQVFGTWYEGDTPYEHTLFCTFNENQEAYDFNIEKLGFDVLD